MDTSSIFSYTSAERLLMDYTKQVKKHTMMSWHVARTRRRLVLQFTGCILFVTMLPGGFLSPAFSEDVAGQIGDCRYNRSQTNSLGSGYHLFERDDVFRPLLADPKQTQFTLVPYQPTRNQQTGEKKTIAAVSFGETFGGLTYQYGEGCNRVQLSLSGAVFSQFDLGAASHDLINADYVIGLPLTVSYEDLSFRLRLYHQSSHLGDEFLLANINKPGFKRLNYSYEEIELLTSYDHDFDDAWIRNVRIYGGGGYMFDVDPHFQRMKLQWGAEIRSKSFGRQFVEGVQNLLPGTDNKPVRMAVVSGVDCKQFEAQAWNINSNFVVGFEFFSLQSLRRVRILFNYYNGFNPYGQFFSQKIYNVGIGVYLTL